MHEPRHDRSAEPHHGRSAEPRHDRSADSRPDRSAVVYMRESRRTGAGSLPLDSCGSW
jgi:hypothetical protein